MTHYVIWYSCPRCSADWREYHKLRFYESVEDVQSTCCGRDIDPSDHEQLDEDEVPESAL